MKPANMGAETSVSFYWTARCNIRDYNIRYWSWVWYNTELTQSRSYNARRSTDLLHKLTVDHLLKKSRTYYTTCRFIPVFTSRHWSLSWASWIHTVTLLPERSVLQLMFEGVWNPLHRGPQIGNHRLHNRPKNNIKENLLSIYDSLYACAWELARKHA
jgi:hypothetical protein